MGRITYPRFLACSGAQAPRLFHAALFTDLQLAMPRQSIRLPPPRSICTAVGGGGMSVDSIERLIAPSSTPRALRDAR